MTEVIQKKDLVNLFNPILYPQEDIKSSPKRSIKTIIFDLGGVFFTDGTSIAIKTLNKLLPIRDLSLLFRLFSNKPLEPGNLLRLGLITIEEFEHALISKLGLKNYNNNLIQNIWFNSYLPHPLMRELVAILSNNYNLVIFSGNVKERIEYLDKKYNFLQFFDSNVFSYDYHLSKSNIEFYYELLNNIDSEPFEAIIIDDKPDNIIKAKSLGLNGILYKDSLSLLEELKNYNIKIDF